MVCTRSPGWRLRSRGDCPAIPVAGVSHARSNAWASGGPLLVVRDLLSGAKRFTDLLERLGGITPKTLTQRLSELEDVGVLTVDREPGRREV
jgi:DNA-binding HxlR family transcriptional regulator